MSTRAMWCVMLALLTCARPEAPFESNCQLVTGGPGPDGVLALEVSTIASGLEVPWAVAFVPGTSDVLVTERPGRVRLIRDGALLPTPVVTIDVANTNEAGLLGLALSPSFNGDRFFFVYYSIDKPGGRVNRVERYLLAADGLSATADEVLLDGIVAGQYHDGGRIRFGPDGMLYVGTGDGRLPERAKDLTSLNGKLLRMTVHGEIPADNPFPGSYVYLSGIRNTQGFDWLDDGAVVLTDHGPTGELARSGHDEVNVARAGDSLGWPDTWGCEARGNVVAPLMVFENAVPPGGSILYRGDAIPEWKGALLVAALAARHLQVIHFDEAHTTVSGHEVYLRGDAPAAYGRLREVVEAPDGSVWLTTSNCDARGTCPPTKDAVLRVVKRL